jgi:dipeptidyl aminopeptidase/acylaminoacyl peptidase
MTSLPPGSWPSPLTAERVARAGVSYGQVAVTDGGRTVWWAESRPAEGGRTTVLRRTADGPAEEVLPATLDARTRVHEYGGACWLVVDGGLITSDLHDQRLWSVLGGTSAPLTPETGLADRYGDPVLLPGGRFVACVRESMGDLVTHELVAVPLDGSAAQDRSAVVVLWSGSDFVSSPAVSPDGASLAFLTWEHPNMPWDGTSLRVGRLDATALSDVAVALGGDGNAVQQPLWRPDGSLWCVAEVDGWWNVVTADGSPVWRVAEECGLPLWTLGLRSVVPLADGRVAVLHGHGARTLSLLSADGTVTPVDVPFTSWRNSLAVSGSTLVAVASTSTTLGRVVALDLDSGAWREVAGPEQPDPAWSPSPEEIAVPSSDGRVVHAYLYPPTSPDATADGLPPYILWVHGGPTGHVMPHYDEEVAYFTSRGIGVVDVNYGGSTGYGRDFRNALRGQWGVVDVEDCESVARSLLAEGTASAVGIRGGSAGGWTVLAALTRGDSVFATGASYFGVVDLLPFAETTHDFESRYLDGLIGPLPEARQLYVDRSPLSHVDRLDRPLLVLQGLDDPVVPPEQAELLVAALKAKGIAHAYLPFEGEAHGFRKAENTAASLEAELSFYGQVLGFVPPDVPVLPVVS